MVNARSIKGAHFVPAEGPCDHDLLGIFIIYRKGNFMR